MIKKVMFDADKYFCGLGPDSYNLQLNTNYTQFTKFIEYYSLIFEECFIII